MEISTGTPAWYVAYGSNLCRDRLRAYLAGTVAGAVAGADAAEGLAARFGVHRGCADPRPPAEDRWCEIPHRVTFRGTSPRWGGGVAFLDVRRDPRVASEVRAWRLTLGQVLDIAAQEARLEVSPEPSLLDGLLVGATASIGGGWYDTLLRLADVDGSPALTVTTTQDLPLTAPTAAYRATIEAGRAERQGARDPGLGPVPGSWP